jgi:hypothetical protein
VLVHWNNSPRIDMVLYLDTLSWLKANQSLLLLLSAEATNNNFSLLLDPIWAWTSDQPHSQRAQEPLHLRCSTWILNCQDQCLSRCTWESSWSYGSWICLSPLTLWVWIPLGRGLLDTTLCDKVCQWLATGRWFSPGTLVPSTNKTDHHDITEILLNVALNIITLNKDSHTYFFCDMQRLHWSRIT